MTEADKSPEDELMRIDAKDRARVNAIKELNAENVSFGDRIEGQRRVLEYSIDPIAPNRDPSVWVDRMQIQAELLERLKAEPTRLVELVASGGFGKSLLAVWATEQVKSEFDQSLWINFSEAPSFNAFGRWVNQEIGFLVEEAIADEELIRQTIYRLSERRCLVVMDQLEAVTDDAARLTFEAFLQQWQQRGSKSTVLITTRQRFFQVEGRGYDCLTVPGFSDDEGAAFLVQKGIAAVQREDLLQLSGLAKGHPLSLILAAGWLQETSTGELNAQGLVFFQRLFQQDIGNLEAQVREVFDELLARLTPLLRTFLLEVVVYRQPFDLEQAQAMQADVSEQDFHRLENRGFLTSQGERWTLHPLIRQFVRNTASTVEWEKSAHQKALDFFSAQLEIDKTNLQDYLECFYHYFALELYEAAYSVIRECQYYLFLQGRYRVLAEIYESLVERWFYDSSDLDFQNKLGDIFGDLGFAYSCLSQYERAIKYYYQALAIKRKVENQKGEATCLNHIGSVYSSLSQYDQAIAYYRQALIISRKLGDRKIEANALGNLGSAHYDLCQYEQAIEYHYQALSIDFEFNNRNGKAASLGSLGLAYFSLCQYERAIEYHHRSLTIKREIGDYPGEASSLCNLGIAYGSLNQHEQAIDYNKRALVIHREVGDRRGEAKTLGNLGLSCESLGQHEQAIEYQQQSLTIDREIGDLKGESNALGSLGSVYYSLCQYERAIKYHHQSLTIKRKIGDRCGEARALGSLGIAYGSLNQHERDIDFQRQALKIRQEIGDRNGEAISLLNRAIAYAKLDNHWFAQEGFEQAKAIFSELNLDHMVEKCEQAIQERNRIIAMQPKKAPSIGPEPTVSPDDWREKSMPTTQPKTTQSTANAQPKNAFGKWLPYLLIAAGVMLLILWLQ